MSILTMDGWRYVNQTPQSLFKNNDLIEYIDASDSNIEEIAADAFQNNSKLSQLLLRFVQFIIVSFEFNPKFQKIRKFQK